MDDWRNFTHMAIWYFKDAPQELQALSTNGGDEDFLAYVPPDSFDGLCASWFGTMDEEKWYGEPTTLKWNDNNGTSFGVCSVDRIELDNGGLVFIGSHA